VVGHSGLDSQSSKERCLVRPRRELSSEKTLKKKNPSSGDQPSAAEEKLKRRKILSADRYEVKEKKDV